MIIYQCIPHCIFGNRFLQMSSLTVRNLLAQVKTVTAKQVVCKILG
jgi:hypothetical protein